MKSSYDQLRKQLSLIEEENNEQTPERKGFNEKGIYDSSDYRTVYHLVTNKELLSLDETFEICLTAFVLTKLIVASDKFFVDSGVPFVPNKKELIMIGNLLSLHIMSIRNNAFEIGEYQVIVVRACHPCMFLFICRLVLSLFPDGHGKINPTSLCRVFVIKALLRRGFRRP